MKNCLPFLIFLLLASGLFGGAPEARASHLLGGDMTYASLGNNQYRVKYRFYRDCSGVTPSAFTLECRNGGCTSTASVTAPLVQQGAVEAGNPFCTAVSSGPCQGPVGLPNYDIYTFLATVTLPPGNWTLSTVQNARPVLANIVGGDLYVEATLDNRNSSTGTAVANSSPQFDPQNIPIQYVCYRQPTTIGFSSVEADGDSLVYSLAAPLQACGVPATYLPYVGAPVNTIISTTPPCFFQAPASPANFSPTMPIPVGYDTTGTCPVKTGTPRFRFNQQARTLSFTPGYYNATASPASGLNKYQMAVLITEYRRINGVRRVIGTVRREVTLIVTDCGGNTVPGTGPLNSSTTNANVQSVNTPDTTQISVYTCNYARVRLAFTDPDNLRVPSANQLLTVTLPTDINTNPQLLDSGEIGTFMLQGNGTTSPVGLFFFQPSPASVGRIISINMQIEDNACPIRGRQTRVLLIKVLQRNFATILAPTGGVFPAINPGGSMALLGFTGRPDSVRRLATNTTQAQTYNYQWTVVGNGNGLPATTNTSTITVSPTISTRYRLSVTPTLGFAQGSCGDTTSIVVQVVPQALTAPTVSGAGNQLTSTLPAIGTSAGYQWYRNGQVLPGAIARTITATVSGSYTVQAFVLISQQRVASPLSSPYAVVLGAQRALPGTSLSVAPNPTPDGRITVALTGYGQPVSLTVIDALGRPVTHAQVAAPNPQGTTQTLDLAPLRSGLYILQVRTANSLETRRIVRQ